MSHEFRQEIKHIMVVLIELREIPGADSIKIRSICIDLSQDLFGFFLAHSTYLLLVFILFFIAL